MFFHDGIAKDNEEMKKFLESLGTMSLTNSQDNSSANARRLLESGDTSGAFLAINMPIFIIIAVFLVFYILVRLIHHNIDNMCLSCSRVHFYTEKIC